MTGRHGDGAVIVLAGAPGSGKSFFAEKRYRPHQILSSDDMRQRLTDDPSAQHVNDLVFDAMHSFLRVRCEHGLATVVDATNVNPNHRKILIDIGRRAGLPVVAVYLDVALHICRWRNEGRSRRVPDDALVRLWEAAQQIDFQAEFDAVRHLGLNDWHEPFDVVLGEIPAGQQGAPWTL